MKKFEMEVLPERKILNISVNGFFEESDGMEFISAYKNTVNSLSNPKDYSLSLDCKKLNVTKADLVDTLAGCMQMYAQDFDKINFVLEKKQLILKMQLSRLINQKNVQDKIQLVED